MLNVNSSLQVNRKLKSARRESGLAYVAILILVAIMSTLGLSFLYKAATLSKATSNRLPGMEAEYLAESAANHAMWGLLNVPGFAPANNMYYMHSLGNGRYGYKVRKPTQTTFATIATIGVMGDNVVEEGYVPYIVPSNVFTVYGSTANPLPRYRRLVGADWSPPGDVTTGGSPTIYWVELEGCPIRKEVVGGAVDSNDDIKLAVWDGSSWGNQQTFTINADRNYKCFDIAYESQSGDALVVGRDGAGSALKYNIWDGNNWDFSSPQVAFSLSGGNVHDVVMASQPGGDEILIAVVTSLNEIQLVRWNGSAFSDLGIIETAPVHNDFRVVEIVYEHQSGDAMVVWSRSGSSALKFRMWNGAALGPEGSLPDFGRVGHVIRGAADADPAGDYIIIGAIDNFYDINVAVWDGDAWIDSREIETAGANYWVQCFDIAWEASGEDALIVFSTWGQTQVSTLAWKKGAALADSTVQAGPSFQGKPWMVRLLPISGTEKIVLLGTGESNELRYCLWTGNKLRGDPGIVLEPGISAVWDIAFDLAEANVPRTGGTGSGSGGGNLPPTVEAGPDQTIYLPSYAMLDGTVTDDGLPNPPATVTTTWSKTSGPGTVTFDEPSLVDTRVIFSEAGTYVLRLMADDSDLTAFDEITITVSSLCLGLVGYWELDETSGTVTSDSSGNGNDGTLMDMDPATDWVPGQLDGGLDFDSINDVVDLGSAPELEDIFDGGGTAAAWIYPVGWGEGGAGRVFSKQDAIAGNHSGWEFSTWGTSNSLIFQRGFSSTIGSWEAPTNSLSLNTWQHVAIVYDGSSDANEPTFYINGVPQTTTEIFVPPSGSPLSDAGMKLSLGNVIVDTGRTFDGIIDDARIYNRMLDSSEIAQLHALTQGGCGGGGSGPSQLLFVVDDASSLTAQDNAKKGLMEGWGWMVTPISASATQGEFDTAVASADVSYVSEEIDSTELGTKLKAHTIGVVNEHPALHSVFGFSSVRVAGTGNPALNTDSAHYITSPFGGSTVLALFSSDQVIGASAGTLPSGLEIIGTWASGTLSPLGGLLVLETGATISGGGTAAGRRVQMPWGGGFDVNTLTGDGLTILRRSLEWGAASGGGGGGSDTDPPTPDPMTWASPPALDSPTAIAMMATTATDPSGVEYYFECTGGGGNDSGWQDSPKYGDSGLAPVTTYTYRVKARDKASPPNETGWSSEESATTSSVPDMYVTDIAMGFLKSGQNYYGQATVWIKDDGGANVSGALVTGNWSGAVSGTAMGTTGGDGKIFFESAEKKFGGTFTFTVTGVSKSGYVYNPALNIETSDSITAP